MVTTIAHLSDLHYQGTDFNAEQWLAVRNAIVRFDPAMIIVSGDLVDHPDEQLLTAAKQELVSLAQEAAAQLFVVPGNHDLFRWGLDVRRGRSPLFDRIFADMTLERAAAPATPAVVPIAASPGWKFWRWRWRRVGPSAAPVPEPHLPPKALRLLRQPDGFPVLLALLDSNKNETIAFAGGSVNTDDLAVLDQELERIEHVYLVRIAVIHHHVLPIAYTSGRVIGAEPLMVLENAGTVLSKLARHRFDLVLHGHKHRQQFARIDFATEVAEGYPIAVASAGSAALFEKNNTRANSFNLITIADHGGITVESVFYGDGVAPDRNSPNSMQVHTYKEPIATAKRRAFVRARERHEIFCRERRTKYEITLNGDLHAEHTIKDLELCGTTDIDRRRHNIIKPTHGRIVVDLELDQQSERDRYRIERDGSSAFVVFPESLARLKTAGYTVLQKGANSMIMTWWEAEERRRAGQIKDPHRVFDEEWVGVSIVYPVGTLTIELALPESFRQVEPFVSCRRYDGFPGYDIDPKLRDGVFAGKAWHYDLAMTAEEQRRLQYFAKRGVWQLVIEQPMVGYLYEICWKVPGEMPSGRMPGDILQWREVLRLLAERIAGGRPTDADRRAMQDFKALCEALAIQLGWGGAGERQSFALFAYAPKEAKLIPVLSHQSWSNSPIRGDFRIPLGDGIAGAAFLQRRSISWAAERPDQSPFIQPVRFPEESADSDTEPKTHLAVPIYHESVQNESRPSPWSVIGVVSFGSSSMASKIPALCHRDLDPDSDERVKAVRLMAQAVVYKILATLGAVR